MVDLANDEMAAGRRCGWITERRRISSPLISIGPGDGWTSARMLPELRRNFAVESVDPTVTKPSSGARSAAAVGDPMPDPPGCPWVVPRRIPKPGCAGGPGHGEPSAGGGLAHAACNTTATTAAPVGQRPFRVASGDTGSSAPRRGRPGTGHPSGRSSRRRKTRTVSATVGSRSTRDSMRRTACNIVVWSRPPKAAPRAG